MSEIQRCTQSPLATSNSATRRHFSLCAAALASTLPRNEIEPINRACLREQQ